MRLSFLIKDFLIKEGGDRFAQSAAALGNCRGIVDMGSSRLGVPKLLAPSMEGVLAASASGHQRGDAQKKEK